MDETRTITLDSYDYKLMLNALNEFRNLKIKENVDTEIIDNLLQKLLDTPIDSCKFDKHKGKELYER